ncbi:UNVERIFIED_CONTAM: hypothetical protein Slati_1370500 [Sesamum latifolium]|uniref:Reverse transcriptase domain-containing protein n=1 Tax=Sesamum latifolium TaxID=2727402 RepID=A0AAW2XJ51_9LAMI
MRAVMEFFINGHLLKQINAALLVLIPKVQAPSSVFYVRPISCCNVLYKAITKIIREVLDSLISPTQNAFVPGRKIGDNILIAQELFAGYNQQSLPKRCALKVDLRKAHNTVEWNFSTMRLFGFPEPFIRWVEECVTTLTFSICINGAAHGFFKGARGLRQVFQRGLDEFATISGLHVNPSKSHLILSKADHVHRPRLLEVLGFQEGHLPIKYLGLPLISSRLTIADCRPILMKTNGRIRGWGGLSLSFATRVQLIKSVLMAMSTYWAMTFILPKGILREIEKRLRAFLWKGVSTVGYPKVAWSQVCKPMSEGGLGVREIRTLNIAMMSLWLWEVVTRNGASLWVQWIYNFLLRDKMFDGVSELRFLGMEKDDPST